MTEHERSRMDGGSNPPSSSMDNVYNMMTKEEKGKLKELMNTIKVLEFQLNATRARLLELQTHLISKYDGEV